MVEWIAFAFLRLAATCLTLAGVSFVAPALALQASGAGAEWVRSVVAGSFSLAVVLLSTGGISLHLRRRQTTWLPDGPRSQTWTGSGFNGWLMLFPLFLIGVPALMLVQLRPLAAFWRDVLALADQLNVCDAAPLGDRRPGPVRARIGMRHSRSTAPPARHAGSEGVSELTTVCMALSTLCHRSGSN